MSDIYRDIYPGLPEGIDTPFTRQAMADVAALIQEAWSTLAWNHKRTGAYLASLQDQGAVQYPYQGDENRVAVFSSAPYADSLEWGHAGFHLAERWGARGGRWKGRTKRGARWAIVPFEHDTPISAGEGATAYRKRVEMPRDVYAQAGALGAGQSLGSYGGRGAQFKDYNALRAQYGDQPWIPNVAGYQWRSSPWSRMTRNNVGPGGQNLGHSTYVTFRTIVEDSSGWVVPPQPGYHFAQQALDRVAPIAQEMLQEAAIRDMELALTAALGGFLE